MELGALYERAEANGGFVTRQDVVDCGVDVDHYDHIVNRDEWQRPFRGVRLLPGAVKTPLLIQKSAIASVKGEVAADRWTAAWLYGLRSRPPRKPMVVVPRNRKPDRRNITVRRTGLWRPDHVQEVQGVPTLTPARLIADLARQGHLERTLVDLALGLRRVAGLTAGELEDAVGAYRRFAPREELGRIASLLSSSESDSGLELLGRHHLEQSGFTPDPEQLTIETVNGRRRLDIVFRQAKVGIEVQSKEYHGDLDAMTRDARKLNAIHDQGEWIVFLLTPIMLSGPAWSEFTGVLDRALARRGCGRVAAA